MDRHAFAPYIAFVCLFLFIMTGTAQALKLPEEYGVNQCKMIANDVHDKFGGEIVFLEPNTYPDQIGHWMNRLEINGNYYYIDYGNQRIFSDKQTAIDWYVEMGIISGLYTNVRMIE